MKEANAKRLNVIATSYMRAAPQKRNNRGEDAYFIHTDIDSGTFVTGVADGVGGWGTEGIDSGLYAQELMARAKALSQEKSLGAKPKMILTRAHQHMNATTKGSCTACIVAFSGDKLQYANLGDSGLFGWRAGSSLPFVRSTEQQHRWNCPFQLGHDTGDEPQLACEGSVQVKPGDIIILATDGFFDNLFDNETMQIISKFMARQQYMDAWPKGENQLPNQSIPQSIAPSDSQSQPQSQSQSSKQSPDVYDIFASLQPPQPQQQNDQSHQAHNSFANSLASSPSTTLSQPLLSPLPQATLAGLHAQASLANPTISLSSSSSSSSSSTFRPLTPASLTSLAELLVHEASKVSSDRRRETPFSKKARHQGKRYRGGKPDDITVVVAQVVSTPTTEEGLLQ